MTDSYLIVKISEKDYEYIRKLIDRDIKNKELSREYQRKKLKKLAKDKGKQPHFYERPIYSPKLIILSDDDE